MRTSGSRRGFNQRKHICTITFFQKDPWWAPSPYDQATPVHLLKSSRSDTSAQHAMPLVRAVEKTTSLEYIVRATNLTFEDSINFGSKLP